MKKLTQSPSKLVVPRRDKNTRISEIEKEYSINLGVRSDMKLGTFLRRKGYPSLAAMLNS